MCVITDINVRGLGLQGSLNHVVVLAVLEWASCVQH